MMKKIFISATAVVIGTVILALREIDDLTIELD